MARQARKNTNLVENLKEINQWFHTLRQKTSKLSFVAIMFKSSTSVNSFKSNLKSNHPQKPPYHYIGKRLGQILHSRLCMHCSSLNQHLYSKNIVDSPLCQCGAIETTEHYFLYCPLYNVHRQLFIEPFFDDPLISYHHYLFGSPEFSYKQNVEIFLAVQSFIINSKRFNRNQSCQFKPRLVF